MSKHVRHDQILDAALALAKRSGWKALTRDRVAEAALVGAGSVNTVFGTIEDLKSAVMREAVNRAIAGDDMLVDLIAEGLCERHPAARAAPEDIKRKALERMM